MSSDAQTGLTVAAAGERQVVERLQHIFERPPNERRAGPRVGNGDDAAVREAPAGDHVSCVDMISAGNDWFDGWTPRAAIGHRALEMWPKTSQINENQPDARPNGPACQSKGRMQDSSSIGLVQAPSSRGPK